MRRSTFFARHAECVEALHRVFDYAVDLVIRALLCLVVRPLRQCVTDGIDVADDAEESNDGAEVARVGRGAEGSPNISAAVLQHRRRGVNGNLDPPQHFDEVARPLRLRLPVTGERSAKAPVADSWPLCDIDQLRELRR